MNRTTTASLAAVAAAAVAVVPMSGALGATSSPSTPSAAAPADLLKSAGASVAGYAHAPKSVGHASFVVITNEALGQKSTALLGRHTTPAALAGASAAEADSAPAVLAAVPDSVAEILAGAGMLLGDVARIQRTSQGVYIIWYKMLTAVPQAVFKGDFAGVPGLFNTAITKTFSCIQSGSAADCPKPDPPKPAGAATVAALATADAAPAPNPRLAAAIDVLRLPMDTVVAGSVVAEKVYTEFAGVLTSVPEKVLKGEFGDVRTIVKTALDRSVDAVEPFPKDWADDAMAKLKALAGNAKEAPVITAPAVADSKDEDARNLTTVGLHRADERLQSGPRPDTQATLQSAPAADPVPVVEPPAPADPALEDPAVTTPSIPVDDPGAGAVAPSAGAGESDTPTAGAETKETDGSEVTGGDSGDSVETGDSGAS